MWFSTAVTKQFRTPAEQASYVLGVFPLLYIMGTCCLIEYFTTKSTESKISTWVYVIVGLGLTQLFEYVYINKERFEFIKNRELTEQKFSIADKNGRKLSILFCVGGFVYFVISVMIVHFLNLRS